MPKPVRTKAGMKTTVTGDLRNGICVDCNIHMKVQKVWIDTKREVDGNTVVTPKLLDRPVCPKCGGMIGQLIVRITPIKSPAPPECLKCIWRFLKESIFVALLSAYHARRVAYAQSNRPENKEILERYRTGEPSPKTIWQAIHANIKLKCPICRKYDKDPLLFRR